MRRLSACLIVIALLVPSAAEAHGHVWDFSFAPATATGSRLWGGRASIGLTSPRAPRPNLKRWSFLIDVTNLKGEHNSEEVTALSYLAGPRLVVLSNDRHVLMLHGIAGIANKHQGATDRTDAAVTVGAAYEWVPKATATSHAGWAARIQVEQAFLPSKSVKGYTQISVGAVKRFE